MARRPTPGTLAKKRLSPAPPLRVSEMLISISRSNYSITPVVLGFCVSCEQLLEYVPTDTSRVMRTSGGRARARRGVDGEGDACDTRSVIRFWRLAEPLAARLRTPRVYYNAPTAGATHRCCVAHCCAPIIASTAADAETMLQCRCTETHAATTITPCSDHCCH